MPTTNTQHLIPFAQKRLHIQTLHLDTEPTEILAEIRELADTLIGSRSTAVGLAAAS